MTPGIIAAAVAGYFSLLLGLAWWTGVRADARSYFIGNKASPWWAVGLGLIGDSLSGVSYISVPGAVGRNQWHYLQIVLGNILGYLVIIHVLLPLYYRRNLTSIYGFLGERFGVSAQRTGAGFFVLARLLGSAARLYLAVNIFQRFMLDAWRVPYGLTATLIIVLMLVYTVRGGIKTLVWTDLLQSGFLVLGIALSVILISRELNLGFSGLISALQQSPLVSVFETNPKSPAFWVKQVLAGAALSLVMTGLDQNSMQKSLSCRSLREAQKNLYTFSAVILGVTTLILSLGTLLQIYAAARAVPLPPSSDELFPSLALQYLSPAVGLVFVLGLTAATFNSADSVLTTLTTSFCLDFLGWHSVESSGNKKAPILEFGAQSDSIRRWIHVGFAALLLLVLMLIRALASGFPVIDLVLKLSGYTGGPLLALFGLGLFTQIRLTGWRVPVTCVASALGCAALEWWTLQSPGRYRFGFELLLLNAAVSAIGLWVASRWEISAETSSSAA